MTQQLTDLLQSPTQSKQTIGKMSKECETCTTDVSFSEYLEKLVILDLIYGSHVQSYYMAENRFPFTISKDMKGSEFSGPYIKNLWGHYHTIYTRLIRDAKTKGDEEAVIESLSPEN